THPPASTTAAAAIYASTPDSPPPLRSAATSNSHPQKKTQSTDGLPAEARASPEHLHDAPANAHSRRYRTLDRRLQRRCTSKLPLIEVYRARRPAESITEASGPQWNCENESCLRQKHRGRASARPL